MDHPSNPHPGFPRPSAHCKTHIAPGARGDLEITPEMLTETLDILRSNKVDLVFGDLVAFGGFNAYRNDGLTIYNGTELMLLDDDSEIDDYGFLPRGVFKVIEHGVPVDYWLDTTYAAGRELGTADENTCGIRHNQIVWFDHKLVREQLFYNICNDEMDTDVGEKQPILAAKFVWCGKAYMLVSHAGANWRSLLGSDQDIIFCKTAPHRGFPTISMSKRAGGYTALAEDGDED